MVRDERDVAIVRDDERKPTRMIVHEAKRRPMPRADALDLVRATLSPLCVERAKDAGGAVWTGWLSSPTFRSFAASGRTRPAVRTTVCAAADAAAKI